MCACQEQSTTSVVLEEESASNSVPILRLRMESPGGGPRVAWAADVIDNEHMGKKKSKCCCIYVKHREWNESSSEDESETECDHCHGHVELKKKKIPHSDDSGHSSDEDGVAKRSAKKKTVPVDKDEGQSSE